MASSTLLLPASPSLLASSHESVNLACGHQGQNLRIQFVIVVSASSFRTGPLRLLVWQVWAGSGLALVPGRWVAAASAILT